MNNKQTALAFQEFERTFGPALEDLTIRIWLESCSTMTRQRRRAQARRDAKDVARHPYTLVNA